MTRQRRWQIKHKEMGLCHQCSEPAVISMLCLKHAIAKRELERKRVGYKRRNNSLTYRLEKKLA